MRSEDIAYTLNTHPAFQMVRLQNARWVLPLLYKVFKEDNRFLVEERALIQLVAETLSSHTEGTENLEEANITFGENEEARSRKYILNWVQKRILQDFTDAEGAVQYQLLSLIHI